MAQRCCGVMSVRLLKARVFYHQESLNVLLQLLLLFIKWMKQERHFLGENFEFTVYQGKNIFFNQRLIKNFTVLL